MGIDISFTLRNEKSIAYFPSHVSLILHIPMACFCQQNYVKDNSDAKTQIKVRIEYLFLYGCYRGYNMVSHP